MRRFIIISALLFVLLFTGGCTQQQEPSTTSESTPIPVATTTQEPPTTPTPIPVASTTQELTPGTCTGVNSAEAKELIDKNPDMVIIDVSIHYADGHLPGAINYAGATGAFTQAISTLDKSKKYLIYCHIDFVSESAAQKLADAGVQNVYWLEDLYSDWVDAGYPVEK